MYAHAAPATSSPDRRFRAFPLRWPHMQQNKLILSVVVAIAFVIGAGYIVYAGRPIMKLQPQSGAVVTPTSTTPVATAPTPTVTSTATASSPTPAPTPKPTPAPTPAPADQPGVYTLATVAKHNSASDCWSAVSGNVYDLTSWIDRHPGGPEAILGMCGTDGTNAYENQHGGSRRPAAMLALLKIGVLK